MINDKVLIEHQQIFENSCVASSVEMVLKLEGFMEPGSFKIQEKYQNTAISGDCFDGKTYHKGAKWLKFHKKVFADLASTFDSIKYELIKKRYVIVPLLTERQNYNYTYHNHVVYALSENGEYRTLTKFWNRADIVDVLDTKRRFAANFKEMISKSSTEKLGIDILIYEKGKAEDGRVSP